MQAGYTSTRDRYVRKLKPRKNLAFAEWNKRPITKMSGCNSSVSVFIKGTSHPRHGGIQRERGKAPLFLTSGHSVTPPARRWRVRFPMGSLGFFLLSLSFWPHCGPSLDSAPGRNEYQGYFLGGKGGQCIGLTTLPPSCTEYLDVLGLSTS